MKSAAEWQRILNEVCFDRTLSVRNTIEAYFSPNYQQVTDGHSSDREAFIQHVIALRNHLRDGEIRVQSFLASERQFDTQSVLTGISLDHEPEALLERALSHRLTVEPDGDRGVEEHPLPRPDDLDRHGQRRGRPEQPVELVRRLPLI